MEKIMSSEHRIKKALHKQFDLLIQERKDLRKDIANQTRSMIGLVVTMTIAIILAVLFKR
jgi:hypothetical protein